MGEPADILGSRGHFYLLNVKRNVMVAASGGKAFGWGTKKNPDQKWHLEPDCKNPGYFYIVSSHKWSQRLVGPRKGKACTYDKGRHNDMLWKFVEQKPLE